MCGRFTLVPGGAERVPEVFDVRGPAPPPRWNVAPSTGVAIVRQPPAAADAVTAGSAESAGLGEARELLEAAWGLLPHWSKGEKGARRSINARSETVHEKPSFRDAFHKRRCLVPASGWYEWQKRADGGPKQPWLLWPEEGGSPDGEGLFALAGIWEERPAEDESGPAGRSFALLTAAARGEVEEVHDRMPVILRPQEYDTWLDAGAERGALQELLLPDARPPLCARRVSTYVNKVANQSERCIEEQRELFEGA